LTTTPAADVADAAVEGLPVRTLLDAAPHLRRPFTPEAIKFKVQTVFGGASGCLIVAYVDARLVIERLNRVIPDGWSPRFEQIPGTGLMWCHLTVDGVTRSDIGESTKGLSKDLVSDALKRAAVHFGVSVSTYALPEIRLFLKEAHGRIEKYKVKTKQGEKDSIRLTEHGHAKLREGYAGWLTAHGIPRFGSPLDHGDVEGATFEEEPETFEPEPAPPLEDDKAKTLIAACQAAYAQLAAANEGEGRKRVPPGRFNGWLAGASHSHEELERLLAHLESVRDELKAEDA
jgi:hypothetical protein